MLAGLGNPVHILIVLGVILLLFGAKRLPELGRSLGTGLREFKTSVTGGDPFDGQGDADASREQLTPPARLP